MFDPRKQEFVLNTYHGTVIIGVFAQGCDSFSRANNSKTGSAPTWKILFSEKPRRSLPHDVLFDVGNHPVV